MTQNSWQVSAFSGAFLAATTALAVTFAPPTPPAHAADRPKNERTCIRILDRHPSWHAGDLCETFQVSKQRTWNRYNRMNGWEKLFRENGITCWYTTTTDDPYSICWDGWLRKN